MHDSIIEVRTFDNGSNIDVFRDKFSHLNNVLETLQQGLSDLNDNVSNNNIISEDVEEEQLRLVIKEMRSELNTLSKLLTNKKENT